MIRRSSLLLLEVVLGLVATAAIAFGAAWWRLAQGPIALPALEKHVEFELAAARGGRPVSIEGVELAWSPEARALILRAVNVRALDAEGRKTLSQSRQVVFTLEPKRFLTGGIAMQEAHFQGGALTVTLKSDGSAAVAFGPPGAPADITIAPPPPGETLTQRVNRVLDGLEEVFTPLGPGGDLRAISIEDIDFVLLDEVRDARWAAQGARFDLARDSRILRLAFEAGLIGPTGGAPVTARVTTDVTFASAIVEVAVQRADSQALAPQAVAGVLGGLRAPVSANVSLGLDRAAGVTRVEGDVTLGRGQYRFGDGALTLDGGQVRGRYDIGSDQLVIEEAALAGSRTRVKGEGRIDRASALFFASTEAPAAFDLSFDTLTLDMPGVFAAPLDVRDLAAKGSLRLAERAVAFERLSFKAEQATATLKGDLFWKTIEGKASAGAKITGQVAGAVSPQTVMRFWPIRFAESARGYLTNALMGGWIEGARFEANLSPEAVSARRLPNDKLKLTFTFRDAQTAYVPGMTPISGGSGRAELRGNGFDLWLDSGQVGDLALSNGRVQISRFEPKGAPARFSGRVEGAARSMVELLRQAPLDLDDHLPFQPASIVGRGVADWSITRPLLNDVPAEDIDFTVDGRFEGVGATTNDQKLTLADWRLRMSGDEKALSFSGPVLIGRSSADITWIETLQNGGERPSRFTVSGRFLSQDLERLGYPIELLATGPIGVGLRGEGSGSTIAEAAVDLDLGEADVALPRRFWAKAGGEGPARVRFAVSRTGDGGYRVADLEMRGRGLAIDGAARLDAKGELLEAALNRIDIAERARGTGSFKRTQAGGLHMTFRGQSFNLGAIISGADSAIQAARYQAQPPKPFDGDIEASAMTLQGGAVLRAGSVEFDSDGRVLTRLSMTGLDPGGQPVFFDIKPKQGERNARITFDSKDAGFALRALTGQDSVRGGVASAEGVWRPGNPSTADLKLVIRDFQLVNMPVMARLLSSVGSLQGMADMLGGEGIAFATLEAPISYANGRVTFGECRMAGPSLGLTAKGGMDLASGTLAIDGVVVPSYGINSILGGLPVLGELLTSRKGEGVVGMTYTIKGPAEQAKVGVNPLSALTPGILRRIFEPFRPADAQAKTTSAAP